MTRITTRKLLIFTIVLSTIIESQCCYAVNFTANASYDICFTPGEDCADKIIKAITQTKQEILVQAYSFSDIYIAKALALAKARGVDVKVILDKSQLEAKYSLVPYLISNNIDPVIDADPAIAHNKLIILDRHIVVGGSYNFTQAAKHKNAENVVIIDDSKFAEKYVKYWFARQSRSKKVGNLQINRNIHAKNNTDSAR